MERAASDMVGTALRAAALGSNVEARRDLRIMISVATHNDPSTAPIIVRSNAPELSRADSCGLSALLIFNRLDSCVVLATCLL
jgi:hypothetical protein